MVKNDYYRFEHFNTKKVRLKPNRVLDRWGEEYKFQYQKGAIKTPAAITPSTSNPPHFNTKKVRLKPIFTS